VKSSFKMLGLGLLAVSLLGCSAIDADPGQYIVVYGQKGEFRGKVTNVDNGRVEYDWWNQRAEPIDGRRQEVVYTSRKDQGASEENQALAITARGVKGSVNVKIVYQLLPTKDGMGAYVMQYHKPLDEFEKTEFWSASQACAASSASDFDPASIQDNPKQLSSKIRECLADKFSFMKLQILDVSFTDVADFGQDFSAIRAGKAQESGRTALLEAQKQRLKIQSEIQSGLTDANWNRKQAEEILAIKRVVAEKGGNPFVSTQVVGTK
jgi:hypothetical protein